MKARPWLLLALFAFSTLSAHAQQACPCVPVSHQWIVNACESWNCAAAAAVLANGDPDVLSIPSGSEDFKWVVLRRVPTGSATVPPDAPFTVESFSALSDAMSRYQAINPDFRPFLFTLQDGGALVVSRSTPQPRRRATGR
jgi:hypothetical protein